MASTIHQGIQRASLDPAFRPEGGLSTYGHRIYTAKTYPYLKIEVSFLAPYRVNGGNEESGRDKIKSISTPFLEYSMRLD
jgi:hypothetical protein